MSNSDPETGDIINDSTEKNSGDDFGIVTADNNPVSGRSSEKPVSVRKSLFEDRAVRDVSVELSVVLGRAQMPIHQLLKMGRGAVIELDATTDDDAWVYANNKLIARGEVMVVDDNLGVSITENVVPSED